MQSDIVREMQEGVIYSVLVAGNESAATHPQRTGVPWMHNERQMVL